VIISPPPKKRSLVGPADQVVDPRLPTRNPRPETRQAVVALPLSGVMCRHRRRVIIAAVVSVQQIRSAHPPSRWSRPARQTDHQSPPKNRSSCPRLLPPKSVSLAGPPLTVIGGPLRHCPRLSPPPKDAACRCPPPPDGIIPTKPFPVSSRQRHRCSSFAPCGDSVRPFRFPVAVQSAGIDILALHFFDVLRICIHSTVVAAPSSPAIPKSASAAVNPIQGNV